MRTILCAILLLPAVPALQAGTPQVLFAENVKGTGVVVEVHGLNRAVLEGLEKASLKLIQRPVPSPVQ